jgi:hypothetical protein
MPRAGLAADTVVDAAALGSAAAGRAGGDALAAVARAYRDYALAHPGTYAAAQRATDLDPADGEAAVEVVLAALETGEGFGIPLDLDDTFARLVGVLDQGLTGLPARAGTGRGS